MDFGWVSFPLRVYRINTNKRTRLAALLWKCPQIPLYRYRILHYLL
jgi:hypothetical protein